MRSFVAVNLEEQWRQKLALQVDPLKEALGQDATWRWVPSNNWHVTLQFLGDWPEPKLESLESVFEEKEWPSIFDLSWGQLDAFPNLNHPRVLFLHGKSDGKADRLAKLVSQRVDEVWPDGPQNRKRFRAHLTLARVRKPLPVSEAARLRGVSIGMIPVVQVRWFRLYESLLKPEGALHRVRREFSLSTSI